ncbi:MAG: AraC family transcriptional regulator [Bacteroidaceae bacterium]|nr:AraC family transcriptional regulator [Bacteroidaceae bacterium]
METNTKPYKIREKAEKEAGYRGLIRAELADELYDGILTIVVAQKKYRDPDYSAKQLAEDLNTNPRYLSAVINSRFGMNYSSLVNEFRVRDAVHYLTDKRYLDKTMEEIGTMSGFSNRQSFYAAFFKEKGEAPHQFKKRHLAR